MVAFAVPESDRSDWVKPDTDSVNVMVALNAPFCIPEGAEMLTPGGSVSTLTVTVFEVAAVFGLPAASAATWPH